MIGGIRMDNIFFSGSITFLLIGSTVGLFYPILRNVAFYMLVPLLMILTGLSTEMAIVISLAHFAALLVPIAVDQFQTGNSDLKLVFITLLGIATGIWLYNALYVYVKHLELLNMVTLFPYIILLGGSVFYRYRPFPLLPKPSHKKRKQLQNFLKRLPGKMWFPTSGVKVPFFIPILLGIMFGFFGKLFGPVVALLITPVLVVVLEIPVMVAVGTAMLVNMLGMLTIVLSSDFVTIPLYLEILLWLFLGSTLVMLMISSFMQRRPYPLPVATLLVIITSVTLLALTASSPGLIIPMDQLGFPSDILGWFGGVRG